MLIEKGKRPLLPLPIANQSHDKKYMFVVFKEPVEDLMMENGQSIKVDVGEFLFVPFATVKRLVQQKICQAI